MEELIIERIASHTESSKDESMSDDYHFLKEMIIRELELILKLGRINKEIESQERQLKDMENERSS